MKNTKRLTFLFQKSDEDLNELWNNCYNNIEKLNHINEYTPYPLDMRNHLNALKINNGSKSFLVKRIKENDIIGFVICGAFFPGFTNDIGFNIGLPYTNKGYASEALSELIRYMGESSESSILGHCYKTNIYSIKTMEKCGFQQIKTLEKKYFGNSVIELKYFK